MKGEQEDGGGGELILELRNDWLVVSERQELELCYIRTAHRYLNTMLPKPPSF